MATARLGKDVIDLEHVTLDRRPAPGEAGDGSGAPLFDNITLRLAPGERVGLVGVNGAGKSTLLRLLSGEVAPTSGKVKRGKTVVPAVLSQEVHELREVDDLRVVELIEREKRSFSVGGKDLTAGQLVEQLGFTNARQWTPIRDLSGGERRRLQLLRLLVGEPMCSCSTSPRTTWTRTPSPRWRTSWTAGPAHSWSSATTGTYWSA